MNSDLVSIIVPVYNKRQQLVSCLDSIINQTYNNIEIILIDDGSSDGSEKICDEYAQYDRRIKTIHIKNGGVGNARNIGINISTGTYIQFVDADDFIEKEMTGSLIDLCKADDFDMVVCGYNQVVEGMVAGKVFSSETKNLKGCNDYFKIIDIFHLDPLCGSPCNRLIKKSIIEKRNIRYNTFATFAEDFMFVIDCVAECKNIFITPECYYNYNIDISDSLSKSTKARVDYAWEQQVSFCDYLFQYMQSNCLMNEYDRVLGEIYFGLLSTSIIVRIRNNIDTSDIICWIMKSIHPSFPFDLNKIRLEDKRAIHDLNSKKRIMGLWFQRGLRLSLIFRFHWLFIRIMKVLLRSENKQI